MTELPYKTQILNRESLELKGRKLSMADIIAELEPLLTPERMARIEQVISQRTYGVATVTEHLYDIGNISAVMRSAESFGFLPFHIVERPDAKYKMSDRISRGTEKWLDIHKYKSSLDCVQKLKDDGYVVCATDLNADCELAEIDFSKKIAFVFGNEKDGISEDMRRLSDHRVRIPMAGFAQSFNISVAAALCFYQAYTERVRLFGKNGDLTDEQKIILKAHYYLRTNSSYFGL